MKRRTTAALGVLLCTLARTSAARADAGPPVADAGDDAEPREVTVRGSQAGGFSSKTREDESPREITDAASLVEPLPGVHVRRLGADDSFATLSIRGSSSTQVAVYLAGVPLTGGADPTLDLATLPLWPAARARVYRSFAPATLGPGSLGGTLVVDPPSAGAPERTEVWAAAGAFGSRRMRLGDVRAIGDDGSRVMTGLSASRSDDDFSYYDGDGNLRTRENAGHAALSGLVAWSVPTKLGNGGPGRLTVTTLAQARRQHLPGTILQPTPRQELDSDRELASVELTGPTTQGAWITRAWGRRDGLRMSDDPRLTQGFSPSHTRDAIVAVGGGAGWRGRALRDVTVDARFDASGERFAPGAWTGATAPPGATRAALGLGSDVEWRPSQALDLTASGRLDTWSDHDAGPSAGRGDLRPTAHLGGEIGSGPFAIATHGGVLSRAPSFVERFGNRGIFLGNPSLRPESAWTLDLGARAATHPGRAIFRIELVGFVTWADDLIVFVSSGITAFRPKNIGRARLVGAEAAVEGKGYGFETRVSYTGLATTNEDACASSAGASCERPPLPYRPAHNVVADLSYGYGPVRIRYGVDAVSGLYAGSSGDNRVPPRVLHSAGVRVDVPGAPGLRLALDVRNLFDVRMAAYDGALGTGTARLPIGDVYEYPLPGRSVLVSARYALGR